MPAPILSFLAVGCRSLKAARGSCQHQGVVGTVLARALLRPRRAGRGCGRWLHWRRLAFESASFRVTFLFSSRCVWAGARRCYRLPLPLHAGAGKCAHAEACVSGRQRRQLSQNAVGAAVRCWSAWWSCEAHELHVSFVRHHEFSVCVEC